MPMRLGKLRKRLKEHGVRVESPKKGSHFKARRNTDEGVYVITAHNADKSEIPDLYINGVCKHFGIDKDLL
jgi:predicted RNA binding protein YcfA (HicA-like mRNA interferase family)